MAGKFDLTEENLQNIFIQSRAGANTLKVSMQHGKPVYFVGREAISTFNEAVERLEEIGLKRFDRFELGKPMPHIGPGAFPDIENILKGVNQIRPGITIERTSHGLEPNVVRSLYKDVLLRTDKRGVRRSYGFEIPSEKTLTVLRFFEGKKELTTEEIFKLQKDAGQDFAGAFDEGKFDPRFMKRLRTQTSIDEYGTTFDRRFKVHELDFRQHVFDDLSEEAKLYGFDGQIIGNPNILREQVRNMETRGKELFDSFPLDDMSEDAVNARRAGKSILEKAKKFNLQIGSGGSYETFRALGLDIGDEAVGGMAKGDISFPPGNQFREQAPTFGYDPDVDFVLSKKNLTPQVGRGVGTIQPFMTLKPNEPNRWIFTEIESLIAHPELYDVKSLSAHTKSVFEARVNDFMTTGKLPQELLDDYAEIAAREVPEGAGTVWGLLNQKQRAKNILKMHELGTNPWENPAYANEAFSSILEWMKNSKREGDPFFLAQGVVGAHIRGALYAKKYKFIDYDVAPGELGFSRNYGMIMHEQTIADTHALFGGFDLDDLLRNHLRIVNDKIMGVGIRNPHSFGETALFDIAEGSFHDIAQQLSRSNPKIKSKAEFLQISADIDVLNNNIKLTEQKLHDSVSFGQDTKGSPVLRKELNDLYDKYHLKLARRNELVGEIGDVSEITSKSLIEEVVPKVDSKNVEAFNLLFGRDLKAVAKERRGKPIPVPNTKVFTPYDEWIETAAGRAYEAEAPKQIMKIAADEFDLKSVIGLGETGAEVRQAVIAKANAQGLLGQFRFVDSVAGSLRQQMIDKNIEGIIPFSEPEKVVDVLTQGIKVGNVTPEEAWKRMYATIYGMADVVSRGGKVSKKLFESRMKGERGREFYRMLQTLNPEMDPESIFLDLNNPEEAKYDIFANFTEGDKQLYEAAEELRLAHVEKIRVPKAIDDIYFNSEEVAKAARIAGTYDVAKDALRQKMMGHGLFGSPWRDEVSKILEDSVSQTAATYAGNVLAEYADESGQLGDEAMRVMGAFWQKFGASHGHLLFKHGIGEAMMQAQSHYALSRPELLTAEQIAGHQKVIDESTIGAVTLRESTDESLDLAQLGKRVTSYIESGEHIPGAIRNRRLRDAAEAAEGVVGAKWKDINIPGIKELFKNPLARKVGLGGAALIAGSFLYQKLRDRSPEDMQGPPMLPGGGPYEDFTPQAMPPSLGNNPTTVNGGGASYRIMARGSFDPSEFQGKAEGIVGANASGSIYSAPNYRNRHKEVSDAIKSTYGGM